MLTLRRSNERGAGNHGWLESMHSFSFAGYFDRNHMGYRALRVINEDHIAAGRGFGEHPHENMEIISYVVSGKLAHRDSMGHGSTIEPGMVQYMSAGTGVRHSEFNGSDSESVHLLQIWILPAVDGTEPRYAEKNFESELASGRLTLLISGDGRDGSIRIGQDADIHGALLASGSKVEHALATGRGAWLQLIRGTLDVNGQTLEAGDAIAADNVVALTIQAKQDSEFLLFDLA